MKTQKPETDGVKISLSPLKKTEIKMKSIIITADRYQMEPTRKATHKSFNPIKYSMDYKRKGSRK